MTNPALPCYRMALLLALGVLLLSLTADAGGAWTALNTPPPSGLQYGLLMSDGTVICANGGTGWYRLTPDIHGSYVNGTWSQIASMNYSRLFFSSDVLTNGNVYVAGGEYGGGPAELYNTLLNTWTVIQPPSENFSDACSKILPNGNVLQSDSQSSYVIYNAASNIMTAGGSCEDMNESCWVRMPNDNILAVTGYSTTSEHYVPSLNAWYADGNVPVPVYGYGAELGAALALPNGKVFQIGGTNNTAIYTPGGTLTSEGSWVEGPQMIFGTNELGAVDAPAAMMITGNILMCIGPETGFDGPCSFYEYNYISNNFTQENAPGGGATYGSSAPFATAMLDLPDGTVLFFGGQGTTSLFVYAPSGAPLAAGQPAISSITENADGSYHLKGVGLNGITGGAAYGDDWQMDTSYPLVRLTNTSSGSVYYARTYNWSSTTIQNTNPVTTEFSLPPALPAGAYSLVVTVMGNASAPVTLNHSPPSAPAGVSATAGNGQVSLSWNAVSGATAYNVLRSTTTGGPYLAVATVANASYVDIVVNGMTFYYVVTAVGSGGPSAYSSQVGASPVGPPPVPALSASGGYLEAILSWTATFEATSYNLKRSSTSGGPYTTVSTISAGITPGTNYADTTITPGSTYYYVVSALNGFGESANSSQVSATPFTVAGGSLHSITCPSGGGYALDSPNGGGSGTGVDQVPYSGVNQQWIVAPVSSGKYKIISAANGLALTGANNESQLVLKTYTGANNQFWTLAANGTNYNIGNVSSGENMDDWGGGSGTIVGQWDAGSGNANQQWTLGVPPPTGLTAVAGNAQVGLNWNPVFGATGYNLERSTTSGGPYTIVSSLSGSSHTDTGLTNGATYFYVVSATNSSGQSAISSQDSATPFANGILYKIACPSGGGFALNNPNGGGSGSAVNQVAYNGVDQQWIAASMGAGRYEILFAGNGFALDGATNNAQLVLEPAAGANNQLWTLTPNGTNYNILNAGSGENMDDWSGGSGTIVGQYSANNSNPNQQWTLTAITPPTPTGLSATGGIDQVSLRWNTSFGASGYSVMRATVSGGPYTGIASLSGTNFTDHGLTNGTTYYYVLSATNAGGASMNCAQVGVTLIGGVTITNGAYVISCPAGGGYVLSDPGGGGSGTGVNQVSYNSVYQQWIIALVTNNQYQITSAANNLALTATNLESQLVLQNYTGTNSQLWTFTPNGTNYNILNVGSVENMDDWGGGSGTIASQWAAISNDVNQQWALTPVAGPLPSPWLTMDIGSVGVGGNAGYASGVFTVNGSGAAISGTADAFRFVYQPIAGNFTLTALVTSQSDTGPSATAGVMARETTNANSRFFGVYVTPTSNQGVEAGYRSTTGGSAEALAGASGPTVPYWVQIVRNDTTFTAYVSSDGLSWTKEGASQTISMAGSIFAGLPVCANNNSILCTATFDDVTLVPGSQTNVPPVVLSAAIQTNGQFTLQFQGVDNLNYFVETSTNLIQWTPIFTNALPSGGNGVFIFTDTNGMGPVRFYRVSQ